MNGEDVLDERCLRPCVGGLVRCVHEGQLLFERSIRLHELLVFAECVAEPQMLQPQCAALDDRMQVHAWRLSFCPDKVSSVWDLSFVLGPVGEPELGKCRNLCLYLVECGDTKNYVEHRLRAQPRHRSAPDVFQHDAGRGDDRSERGLDLRVCEGHVSLYSMTRSSDMHVLRSLTLQVSRPPSPFSGASAPFFVSSAGSGESGCPRILGCRRYNSVARSRSSDRLSEGQQISVWRKDEKFSLAVALVRGPMHVALRQSVESGF